MDTVWRRGNPKQRNMERCDITMYWYRHLPDGTFVWETWCLRHSLYSRIIIP